MTSIPEYRVCAKCKLEKPIAQFPRNKSKTGGHGYVCKVCGSIRSKARNQERTEEAKAKDNERSRQYRERLGEVKKEMDRASRERNKDAFKKRYTERMTDPQERLKANVRHKFGRAIRNGYIEKCVGKVFHHVDYDRPYYGAWVTHAEHQRIHHGLLECPPCIDYEEQVNEGIKRGRQRGAYATARIRWGYGDN